MVNATHYKFILGIDISKKHLDCCLIHGNKTIWEGKVGNTKSGLANLKKTIRRLGIANGDLLICCENTGIYTCPLLRFVQKHKCNLWLEAPIAINKSRGLVRAKTDKVDAQRIAHYAHRFGDKCKLWVPPIPIISKLKMLYKSRKLLLKMSRQMRQQLQEIKEMDSKASYTEVAKSYRYTLKAVGKDIKRVESEIWATLSSDEKLHNLYKTITFIDGIGHVTAVLIIVLTEGFAKLKDPRKLACFAGVVPFPNKSGTSIRGRNQVSPFANKDLKTALHLCALASIKMNGQFADYYHRKKAEGKHTMSVINAIRNKLLRTLCACVRKDETYDKHYTLDVSEKAA